MCEVGREKVGDREADRLIAGPSIHITFLLSCSVRLTTARKWEIARSRYEQSE